MSDPPRSNHQIQNITGKLYVRIKRGRKTYYIHCTETDTPVKIKTEISKIEGGIDIEKIGLMFGDPLRVLDDAASLSQNEVQNNALIFLIFQEA
eukprot:gene2300-273_t